MPTTNYVLQPDANVYVQAVRWAAMPNGNDGQAFEASWYNDRSVQVNGTFGSGGSVTLQGSNDGTNWVTLTDPAGSALTFTSAGLKAILPLPRYIRPNVTAGDGTTSLNVILFMRGDVK